MHRLPPAQGRAGGAGTHLVSSGARGVAVTHRGRSVTLTPFHVAVQVRDLEEARRFYTQVVGCAEGRSATDWADFNMFGHQFVCHLNPELGRNGSVASHRNLVDGHGVPVPHCGVVLEPRQWAELAARLRKHKVDWVIEPYARFVNHSRPGSPRASVSLCSMPCSSEFTCRRRAVVSFTSPAST